MMILIPVVSEYIAEDHDIEQLRSWFWRDAETWYPCRGGGKAKAARGDGERPCVGRCPPVWLGMVFLYDRARGRNQ